MGGSKNIQTDNTEQLESRVSPDSFFKKYTVPTPEEHVASDEPIFKKYAPPRREGSEIATDKPSAQVFDMPVTCSTEAIAKWSKSQVPFYVWGGAAAILILAGWMILSLLLHKHETSTQRTDTNNPPSAEETSPGVSVNGLPFESPASGSLASILGGSSNEKQKDRSTPAQSPRLAISSPDFVHNMMVARAREFEDRGMLSRAEEEYRAVAASFPGDRLSQVGLSRVQGALTAKRVNEMSRVSRETGLRNFRMADYAGAERELSAAVDAGRTDTATLYALGMSHLRLGNHAKAKLNLDHCIAVSPNYAPALVGLAQANAATGRRDHSLSLLQRALELGGGAEFTPAKIRDMIAKLDPKRAVPDPSVSSVLSVERAQPFVAHVVHAHDLLLASCKGDLQIVNSVVHYNASTPSHSFHVLASQVSDARITGDMLRFRVYGRSYRFALNERIARDFLNALIAD